MEKGMEQEQRHLLGLNDTMLSEMFLQKGGVAVGLPPEIRFEPKLLFCDLLF